MQIILFVWIKAHSHHSALYKLRRICGEALSAGGRTSYSTSAGSRHEDCVRGRYRN